MKKTCILALCAGCCFGAHSMAEDTPLNMGRIAMPAPTDAGFSGRPVVVVWGTNASDFRGYNTATPAARAANDINFAGGPAASIDGNVHLVGSYFAVVTPAGATQLTCDIRVSVYSTFTGWVDGTFPGTNLAGQATFAGFVGNEGFVNFYDPTTNIAMELGNVPNTAGTDGLYVVEIFSPGTTTLHPTSWAPASIGTALVNASSDPVRWGDSTGPGGVGPADGLIQAYTAGGAALECNLANVSGGRAIYGGLWGDVPIVCQNCSPNHVTLTEGITTRAISISPQTVRWLAFAMPPSADDDLLKYLDIDSEGSESGVDMCLYRNDGSIVGYPGRDEGSGLAAQLSFGVGRRLGFGDGAQYHGRHGDLEGGLNLTYYLAIGPDGTLFGPSYVVVPPASAALNATINFRKNVFSGANGPSSPPILNGLQYGDLTPGVNAGSTQQLSAFSLDSVRWSQFTLTNCVSSAGGYVDLDFSSLSDGIADVVAWIFDSEGNIVAFSDDVGETNKPQFSFGVASPARPAPGSSTQAFAGQNGNLPYGTYYIATALFGNDNSDLSFLPTGHRWHARSTAASSLNAGCNINYAFNFAEQCPLPTCDSIDFNNDDSIFDPIDLDAFLSMYSEGPCIPTEATCNDIDFNNDGSVFDPCDITNFLQVFGEGPCVLCGT